MLAIMWLFLSLWSLQLTAADMTAPVATVPITASLPPDPHEAFNREVFAFNTWLVRDIIDPTANWLGKVTPQPLQDAGHNIYNNLVEPEFIVTNLFAGDQEGAKISGQRFLINTTVGVLGVWDAAGWMGYERREVEFIESLCMAGLDPGNFIILPAIGSASVYPAALITGFFAVEWYLLAHISTVLATADLVVDLSASAASLRYTRDIPGEHNPDPYLIQRAEFMRYLNNHCVPKTSPPAAL